MEYNQFVYIQNT